MCSEMASRKQGAGNKELKTVENMHVEEDGDKEKTRNVAQHPNYSMSQLKHCAITKPQPHDRVRIFIVHAIIVADCARTVGSYYFLADLT